MAAGTGFVLGAALAAALLHLRLAKLPAQRAVAWLLAVEACLLAGFLLAFVLKYMAVGIVYATWAGIGIALVCIFSVILWGQRFDAAALGGIALIVAGVLLITLKSEVTFQ